MQRQFLTILTVVAALWWTPLLAAGEDLSETAAPPADAVELLATAALLRHALGETSAAEAVAGIGKEIGLLSSATPETRLETVRGLVTRYLDLADGAVAEASARPGEFPKETGPALAIVKLAVLRSSIENDLQQGVVSLNKIRQIGEIIGWTRRMPETDMLVLHDRLVDAAGAALVAVETPERPEDREEGGYEMDTNRPGSDFTAFASPEPDPAFCAKTCADMDLCVAWTYVKPGINGPDPQCWLKQAVPSPVADACCVSGLK